MNHQAVRRPLGRTGQRVHTCPHPQGDPFLANVCFGVEEEYILETCRSSIFSTSVTFELEPDIISDERRYIRQTLWSFVFDVNDKQTD